MAPALDVSEDVMSSGGSIEDGGEGETGGDEDVGIVRAVLGIWKGLNGMQDLRPSESVNQLLGELVGLCTAPVSEAALGKVVSHPEILKILPSIRRICAEAEYHLEAHWSEYISEAQDEKGALTRMMEFPYYENYLDLTRMELAALYAVDPKPPQKIAFIGSGPLPLTPLCLLHALRTSFGNPFPPSPSSVEAEITVLNVDHNSHAISQSRALGSKLGLRGQGMEFLCREAGACDLRAYDVVFIAALVGNTQVEKEELLISVVKGMRDGALMVVRTAKGLRGVLYPEFEPAAEKVLRWTHNYRNLQPLAKEISTRNDVVYATEISTTSIPS
ncbi:hypothetical protein B7494_g2647 [Chlorociboria aeruginascens]|nr:hypothetical protein B7494_g2647 [Chlorociboria aeruginascens]